MPQHLRVGRSAARVAAATWRGFAGAHWRSLCSVSICNPPYASASAFTATNWEVAPMAALLARPAPVAALARPLSRCSSRLAAAWTAPWPQQRPQAPERDARVAARNRLAELLQDMRQEEAEEDSSVPVGERIEAPTPPPPPPLPPLLLAPRFCCCRLAATLPAAHPIPPHNYFFANSHQAGVAVAARGAALPRPAAAGAECAHRRL